MVHVNQPPESPTPDSVESDGCTNANFRPGQSSKFAVRFAPQGAGPTSSDFEIEVYSTDGSFAYVELAGIGM